MEHVETIIIGGGPAGSSCARRLVQNGRQVLVLDKSDFPRLKLCAGWVTAKAMRDLEITPEDYPHPIMELNSRAHIRGVPFAVRWSPLGGVNYSIRRTEFDAWLLERSGAPVERHTVKAIRKEGEFFIIDDSYSCRYLVGAGGTACPVARMFFPGNRHKGRQVVTLEWEFSYPERDDLCRMYLLRYGLKGYGWVVPKGDGMINIGLGGKSNYYKQDPKGLRGHFKDFLADLAREGVLDTKTVEGFKEKGHPYYLHRRAGEVKQGNCFIIGDAAGLATVDMGEGIGPAVESGHMAADEIMDVGVYSKTAVTKFSSDGITRRIAEKVYAWNRRPGKRRQKKA